MLFTERRTRRRAPFSAVRISVGADNMPYIAPQIEPTRPPMVEHAEDPFAVDLDEHQARARRVATRVIYITGTLSAILLYIVTHTPHG